VLLMTKALAAIGVAAALVFGLSVDDMERLD
jgi:hypothetical protein